MTPSADSPNPPADTVRGKAETWLGRQFEVEVGPVAHGGHFVARHEGRVIFVRHALPGELVAVVITEDGGGSFCRGDAVQVRQASPDRVPASCGLAVPGGCGGCDFQHINSAAQRELKAAVVAEQFHRLAGLTVDVVVQPLEPADLGWRRRVRFAVDANGRLGLRGHRSHQVHQIESCPIAHSSINASSALAADWSGYGEVEIAVDDHGDVAVMGIVGPRKPQRGRGGQRRRGRHRSPNSAPSNLQQTPQESDTDLHYRIGQRAFAVHAAGFWQTHPQAADIFSDTVLQFARPQPGEHALDLYAGAGLFTAALADELGPTGRVVGMEGDPAAVVDASRNLGSAIGAEIRQLAVTASSVSEAAETMGGVDLIVLDPPRSGAGASVMKAVAELGASRIVYVACDPAALARDVAIATEQGWVLAGLRAFDAFPMTHHVECIALLERQAH